MNEKVYFEFALLTNKNFRQAGVEPSYFNFINKYEYLRASIVARCSLVEEPA